MPFLLARIGAAVLLLVAIGPLPYDFYTIMRWVVCAVSAYGAYREFGRKRVGWAWTFVVLGVTFNPISPVYLSRETWAPLDAVSACILIGSVLMERKQ